MIEDKSAVYHSIKREEHRIRLNELLDKRNEVFREKPWLQNLYVIEGIDGSGKSSVIEQVATKLRERRNLRVATFSQPSKEGSGKVFRDTLSSGVVPDLETAMKLLNQDREETLAAAVPFLQSGYIVILDRYYYSALAYQSFGLGEDGVFELIRRFDPESSALPEQRTFWLRTDPVTAIRRMGSSRESADAMENLERVTHCHQVYRKLARLPWFQTVNTTGVKIGKVANEIYNWITTP